MFEERVAQVPRETERADLMRTPIWFAVIAGALACSAGDEPTEPRFSRLATDVVGDAHTDLMWTARDTGRELSWLDAEGHCRALAAGSGGAAWRLPSIEELAALYDPSMEQPCGEAAICQIDPVIDLSSPYQWSASAPRPDRRVYYDFALGSQLAPLIRPTLTRRALCTRTRGDHRPDRRPAGTTSPASDVVVARIDRSDSP